MLTRYEKRAGVIGCPLSIKCAMLKVKRSMNIFFFKRNAKYINYHTFSGIPLTPRLQKVIFFTLSIKFHRSRSHFLSDVFAAVAVVVS